MHEIAGKKAMRPIFKYKHGNFKKKQGIENGLTKLQKHWKNAHTNAVDFVEEF